MSPFSLTHRASLKRAFDVSLSFVALVVIAPILIVVAAAIWVVDWGPVFFTQERLGRDRRPFRVLKFRTMVVNAEVVTGPMWSWAGDPRVTRLGRFLRATHLDELPQLWNVLRGEMSLVGPRPERAVFVDRLEQVVPGYARRFEVRPGITGLSQLRSGYDESVRSVRRKIRYDLLYIERACALLDAMILLETVFYSVGLSGGLTMRKLAVQGIALRRVPLRSHTRTELGILRP